MGQLRKLGGHEDAEGPMHIRIGQGQSGSAPRIWNVPRRNPNFTGREELLAALRVDLHGGDVAGLTQALYGLGGVGKSQAAIEYAHRHAGDYSLVWWLNAAAPERLAAEYAALAAELDLPEKDAAGLPEAIAAVRRELEHRGGWLLIFDDVRQPGDLHDYLPTTETGHTIITSRHAAWRAHASPLEVNVPRTAEAADFLRRRTGRPNDPDAPALARSLGCLPLALEQAGAYVEDAGMSLGEYLRTFRKRPLKLLDQASETSGYPRSVVTTWDFALAALAPEAAALINFCAFLAPAQLPIDLLRSAVRFLPKRLAAAVADEAAFHACLTDFRRFSLVAVGRYSLTLHRLVQLVVRSRLSEKERAIWAEAAVRFVGNCFPVGSQIRLDAWDLCRILLPHARVVSRRAQAYRVAPDATARLLNEAGAYLWASGGRAKARELFERALQIDEARLGPNHRHVAVRANNLGRVLQDLGRLDEARQYLQRAMEIDRALLAPGHPRLATRLNNLGAVLRALGDLPAAKKLFQQALGIDTAALGAEHSRVATRLSNLGTVLHALGNLKEAKHSFQRALKIDLNVLGDSHPNVGIRLHNLAAVLRDLGDLPRAKQCCRQALEIDESAFGPTHPRVAGRAISLAAILKQTGDAAGAAELARRADEILRNCAAEDNPGADEARRRAERLR